VSEYVVVVVPVSATRVEYDPAPVFLSIWYPVRVPLPSYAGAVQERSISVSETAEAERAVGIPGTVSTKAVRKDTLR
jgi:hypothetical protein